MKVVLFCGGYGMRMRDDHGEGLPKPMQMVGPRPLIWHIMRYFAHYGHTEFILCLGYGAQHVKDYFLNYQETASHDFVLRKGEVELCGSDLQDWTVHFVDTGVESPIGERLRRVRHLLEGDEVFLANYSDVLTDAPLPEMIARRAQLGSAASMMLVRPSGSFHTVTQSGGYATGLSTADDLDLWVNGGYFVLTHEVFDHIPPGGDLVGDGIEALIGKGRVSVYQHEGFWKPADTFKERADLDQAYATGASPWRVWDDDRAVIF
jgi:glucose-1-phosphate cytidylyltransferase